MCGFQFGQRSYHISNSDTLSQFSERACILCFYVNFPEATRQAVEDRETQKRLRSTPYRPRCGSGRIGRLFVVRCATSRGGGDEPSKHREAWDTGSADDVCTSHCIRRSQRNSQIASISGKRAQVYRFSKILVQIDNK